MTTTPHVSATPSAPQADEDLHDEGAKRTYTLRISDDWGGESSDIEIEAETDEDAIDQIKQHVDSSIAYYRSEGGSVELSWELTDDDGDIIESDSQTYDFEEAIPSRFLSDNSCGDMPSDHDWTHKGEPGCDNNPGVWGGPGTTMIFMSHCAVCGLHQTVTDPGTQRNPGQHKRVEYQRAPDVEEDEDEDDG